MAWNKLKIINLAIGFLGSENVSGYESKLSQSASEYFDLILSSVSGESNLNFARKWAELTKNDKKPLNDRFQYEYELPSDYLRMVSLMPNVDYDIYSKNRLWANVSNLKIEYMSLVDPTALSAAFVWYLALEVAHMLSISILENASLSEKIERKLKTAKASAYSQEARSVPNAVCQNHQYISVRYNSA